MKKSFLIIFGILIIVVLLAVWVYLLFFAKTEENIGLFTNFIGGEEALVAPLPETPVEENVPVNLERPPLRQLTVRPVAGFKEIVDTNDTLQIYFVELGTGHLYSINLESGEEQRLSGTTKAQAREAYISDDGNTVAIMSYNNTKMKNLSLFRLDRENNALTEVITEVVQDFYLNNNQLFYTIREESGLVAYAYDLDTLAKSTVFSLPFYEARVKWGDTVSGPHYVYPKTTYALQGFLYEIEAGKLNRLPLEGFGFSALVSEDTILFTKITEGSLMSYFYNRKTNETLSLGQVVLPEKCLIIESTPFFVCPLDTINKLPQQMPDRWYQGSLSFVDNLVQINSVDGASDIIVDILAESGRQIDVLKLSYDDFSASYFFTNKNDNSLWMYESY